jgi:hypothetical protein
MDRIAIGILFTGLVLAASPASAYVDPGTGGMLTQLVTCGMAGLAVLVKLYWQKIKSAAAGLKPGPPSGPSSAAGLKPGPPPGPPSGPPSLGE